MSQFGGAGCDNLWDHTPVNEDSDLDLMWGEREAHLWNSASAKDAPGTLSRPCSSVSTLPALLHLHGTNLQDKFLFSRPFLCQLFVCVCVWERFYEDGSGFKTKSWC